MSLVKSIRTASFSISLTVTALNVAALVVASPAWAVWGDRWGEMVWGDAGSTLQLPLLSDEGLLVMVASVLLIGALLARRRHVGRRAPR